MQNKEREFLERAAIFQKSIDWCLDELAAVQTEIQYLDDNPNAPNNATRMKRQKDKLVYLIPKFDYESRQLETLDQERLKLIENR